MASDAQSHSLRAWRQQPSECIDNHVTDDAHPLRMWWQRLNVFLVSLIIHAIAYAPFLSRPHFSVDGYINYFSLDTDVFLRSGRLVSWLVVSALSSLGINLLHIQLLATVLFILAFSLFATCLYNMAFADLKHEMSTLQRAVSVIAVNLSFVNVFIWEWYTFVESYAWYAVAVGLALLSLYLARKNHGLIPASMLMACAMMTYQIAIPMAAIWGIMIAVCNTRLSFDRTFYKGALRVLAVCAIGAVLGMLIPKVLEAFGVIAIDRTGTSSIEQVISNIKGLVSLQYQFWISGCNFLPKYSNIVFLVACLSCIIVLQRRSDVPVTQTLKTVLLLVACYFMSIAAHAIVASYYTPPRTLAGIYCFWSLCWACVVVLLHGRPEGNGMFEWVPLVIVGLFLALNIACMWDATKGHFTANEADEDYARKVVGVIEDYEHAHGIAVDTVHFANDESPTYLPTDSERYVYYGTNVLSAPTSWATVQLINYYSGRTFKGEAMSPSEMARYYPDAPNYTVFGSEQIAFDGSDAYLLVY